MERDTGWRGKKRRGEGERERRRWAKKIDSFFVSYLMAVAEDSVRVNKSNSERLSTSSEL